MWLSKMKVERLIAEARTLHGLIPRARDEPDQSLKTGWKSSAVELAPHNSLDYRIGDWSFQQRLKMADMEGMTLRDFEKRLA
jgi:hypothetical protein